MILSRLAKATDAPKISELMSPKQIGGAIDSDHRIAALDYQRDSRCRCDVRTMKGEKVVVPPPLVFIVVAAALVPHQSSVALMVVPPFLRLLPTPVAELPAQRLKVMVSGPNWESPRIAVRNQPLPVAVLPVMVTWV